MAIKLQYWLIASVTLNAALIGVVGGRMFGASSAPPVISTYEGVGSRPVSAQIQEAWAKLPEADRKELGGQFKVLNEETLAVTARLKETAGRIAEIARQDPYDGELLEDTVVVYRHLAAGLQQQVDDTLIGHLGKMPAESREVAARGLLTPYYAWMKPRTPATVEPAVSAAPTTPPSGQN